MPINSTSPKPNFSAQNNKLQEDNRQANELILFQGGLEEATDIELSNYAIKGPSDNALKRKLLNEDESNKKIKLENNDEDEKDELDIIQNIEAANSLDYNSMCSYINIAIIKNSMQILDSIISKLDKNKYLIYQIYIYLKELSMNVYNRLTNINYEKSLKNQMSIVCFLNHLLDKYKNEIDDYKMESTLNYPSEVLLYNLFGLPNIEYYKSSKSILGFLIYKNMQVLHSLNKS